MTFFESSSRSIFLFEHDLRANASRLSRGKTGTHFSGSCSSSTESESRRSAVQESDIGEIQVSGRGLRMDRRGFKSSESRFAAYVEGLASVIGHKDREQPLRDYCTGLMLRGERKSVEPIA